MLLQSKWKTPADYGSWTFSVLKKMANENGRSNIEISKLRWLPYGKGNPVIQTKESRALNIM